MERRYPKGIVLSPDLRVTGRAQCIAVKGMSLLTPKSVNEMMNTKVQRCWETPSQPSRQSQWRWKRWGWGQEVVGGKKWLMPSKSTIDKKIFISHVLCQFVKRKIPTVSFFFPTFTIAFSSSPPTGLTWCLPAMLNFGVHCVVHWLWHQ